MVLFQIDVLKVDKAKAMRRYNRRRTVKWIVGLCAALFVLWLSLAWLPDAAETACQLFRRFIAVFDCTFYIFILITAIIFILYAFSGENEDVTDIYDDFLIYKPRSKLTSGDELPAQPETDSSPTETFHDKHIVFLDNANTPGQDDGTVSAITKRTASPIPPDRAAVVTEKALLEKRYRRAKSEMHELRIMETTRRELRRPETRICQELVRFGEEPANRSFSYPLEELSIEEFNHVVEAFISDKREVQREEYKEERRTESSLALTTQN